MATVNRRNPKTFPLTGRVYRIAGSELSDGVNSLTIFDPGWDETVGSIDGIVLNVALLASATTTATVNLVADSVGRAADNTLMTLVVANAPAIGHVDVMVY